MSTAKGETKPQYIVAAGVAGADLFYIRIVDTFELAKSAVNTLRNALYGSTVEGLSISITLRVS